MMRQYDAILIPGGGLEKDGAPHAWTRKCIEKAAELYKGEHVIALSGGTVHKPPVLDKKGMPIFESFASGSCLRSLGLPEKNIIREWASYDTIGNAYFSRVIHTDPREWKRLLVICPDFHLKRVVAIFMWVFGLDSPQPPYRIDFLAVSGYKIGKRLLKAKTNREARSLRQVLRLRKRIRTMEHLHRWLFETHGAYAMAAKPKPLHGKILDSY